jgi:hypothetical protein
MWEGPLERSEERSWTNSVIVFGWKGGGKGAKGVDKRTRNKREWTDRRALDVREQEERELNRQTRESWQRRKGSFQDKGGQG